MEEPQQFKLRWNNHRETLIKVLNNLLNNGAYVDCTLAAEGKQISAHKIVLSACSSYLNDILQAHENKHPVLILKDIKFSDLEAMVDYMYNGEVNVLQENLNRFLKAAESLQLAGLSTNIDTNEPLKRKLPPLHRGKVTPPKVQKLENSFVNKPNENAEDTKNKPIVVNGTELPPVNAPLQQLENFERNFKEKYERNRSNLGNITNSSASYNNYKEEEEDDVNFDSSNEAGPSQMTSVAEEDHNRCVRCEEKFESKHELLNHSLNQCGRSFQPFKCPRCSKCYSYKRALQSHMINDCGQQPLYRCPYCSQRSAHPGNLATHVKKTHPDQYEQYLLVVHGSSN